MTQVGWIVLLTLIALTKFIYLFVGALILLIPRERFEGWADLAAFSTDLIRDGGPRAPHLEWPCVVARPCFGKSGPAVDAHQQLQFVQANPLGFLATAARSYIEQMTPYRHMFIGVLGWLDTHLPWWFVESYACLLLAVGLSDGGPSLRLGARSRLILGLTVLVMMIGLSFIFYLTWTEVGGLLVKGVQGRYFIPVAPLVLLVMTSEKAGGVSARDRVVRGRDFAGPRRALLYMTLSGLKVMTPQATGKQERSKGGGRTIALDSWNRIFRGRATRAC